MTDALELFEVFVFRTRSTGAHVHSVLAGQGVLVPSLLADPRSDTAALEIGRAILLAVEVHRLKNEERNAAGI